MTNPVIHLAVFIAAVIIPGGLIAYFCWRALRKGDGVEYPTPEKALQDFLSKYPVESLRAKSRLARIHAARALKTRPRKKSQ
tara:strand:- start:30 stop:275 length:246 start_codon:yes stop_codon:yes gene_type:complete